MIYCTNFIYSTSFYPQEAEDFFQGLGFPPLPGRVWESSVLGPEEKQTGSCHPRAIDMFTPGDYR